MGFLADFVYAHSGNEAPDSFYIWSGLTLLGHLAGPKVYYMNGQYKTLLSLYCGLIGTAGSGKSTAKNAMKDVLVTHFPGIMTSANIQSREDIIKLMGDDKNAHGWKDIKTGELQLFHPFFLIANEFQNFLSVNPMGMISFLVDIHGERHFSDSYKNQGKTSFPNPHMSILSCGTKEWVMAELKLSLLSGGLGRRLILVVDEPKEPIPFPHKPLDWQPAYDRMLAHLKWIFDETFQGEIVRTDSATEWYKEWYVPYKKNIPDDPILQQFHSTENVMLIKVACLLVIEDYDPARNSEGLRLLTDDHFQRAHLLIEGNKPKIRELSGGIGRNEIAQYGMQIIQLLTRIGTGLPKDKVLGVMGRDLKLPEFDEQINVLKRTQGLIEVEIPQLSGKWWLFLRHHYEQKLKEQAAGGKK